MVRRVIRPPSSHRLNHEYTEGVMSTWYRIGDWGYSMADHWVENHKRDSWRRQAKASGYRARSAFKLKQIQAKFELMREGDVVLDVGCHPGGWAQVAVEEVGGDGIVIGVDLEPCQPVEGALLMVGDITDPLTQERIVKQLEDRHVNSVISDISPHITGKWDVDQAVAMTLVAKVFDFALPLLCSGGWFVTKLFQGVGVEELIEAVKPHFSYVRRFSPEASRNSSSEVYLVCRNHTPWNAKSTSVLARFEEAVDKILGGDDIEEDVVATTTKFTVRRKKSQ
jgi:23S rRNA (uridine2552-2'-O)-methyltransferase